MYEFRFRHRPTGREVSIVSTTGNDLTPHVGWGHEFPWDSHSTDVMQAYRGASDTFDFITSAIITEPAFAKSR